MRSTLLPLLALAACTGKDSPPDNQFETGDTSIPVCGRVRGTDGALLMDAGDIDQVHYPKEAPDGVKRTTGVAGPIGDDRTMALVQDGDIFRSTDGGCDWEEAGSLPEDGTWQLVAAGSRLYAFDQVQTRGARSDDLGDSWTPFNPSELFRGLPVVADSDPAWIRGVGQTSVISSNDGGDSWSSTGNLPESAAGVNWASISAGDLDVIAVGAGNGVFTSVTGGLSWDDHTAGLEGADVGTVYVPKVALSPDDANVLFALSSGPDAVYSVSRSPDLGASWTLLGDSDGFGLGPRSGMWAIPGDPQSVLTHYIDTDPDFPLQIHLSTLGTGTHTVRTAQYQQLTNIAFNAELWVASVHGVPE